jgi:hypothetical protein
MSEIQPGSYVHGSDSSDFCFSRRGAVGTYLRKYYLNGKPLFVLGDRKKNGHVSRTFGSYSFIRRLSRKEMRDVLQAYREYHHERHAIDKWFEQTGERPPPLGDQIRAFLKNQQPAIP